MFVGLLLALLTQAPKPVSPCNERVPELLFSRLVELPAVYSQSDLSLEKLRAVTNAQAAKMCVTPAPVFLHWHEWERVTDPVDDDMPEYPKQKELDAWLQGGVGAVVLVLNGGKPDPESLTGDALCDRAMEAVAPGLHAASEPIEDAANKAWRKKWPIAAVAKFYGDACKSDRLHATHRAALVCYARARGSIFKRIDRMDDCDLDIDPALDEWVMKVSDRLDAAIDKRR